MATKKVPVIERFWPKVAVGAPDECWPWIARIADNGYGQFSGESRRPEGAHRVAWRLTYGPIPNGLYVLHTCDFRACCNPSHLYVGTQKQNMRDRKERGGPWKGGSPRGERSGHARFTNIEAARIRLQYANGHHTYAALAREHNVAENTIRSLIRGWTYAVPDANIVYPNDQGEAP